MSFIIGIDIGTTNTKAIAFMDTGAVLAEASSSYPAFTTQDGGHELDPQQLLEAVLTVLRDVLSRTADRKGLAGISLSCAMHSLLAVDGRGAPLTRAITWADQRSKPFADELKGSEAGAKIYRQTGLPIHPMSPLCKLLWMRQQLPDIFGRAVKFISIKEYIWWSFFGKYQVDHSIASATGLFDIYAVDWYRESLELAGIREDQLSQPVPCTHWESGIAKSWRLDGLPDGLPFVIGGSDGCLANLGSNAVAPGETALTIGTSGALRMTTTSLKYDAAERIFQYILADHLYVSGGATNNGGGAMQWYASNFGGGAGIRELISAAGDVAPGSDGLIFLPYLLGERAPIWNADAKALFFGIRSSHEQRHFTRAVMEGIIYDLYQVGASLEETIGPIRHIYASGGFTHSRTWLQMTADVFGKTVFTTSGADASAIGASIMGFYALDIIPDLGAASRMIHVQDRYEPDEGRHAVYRKGYERFTALYDRLRDLM
jgi:gluconokinase